MPNISFCLKQNAFSNQLDAIWEEAEQDQIVPYSNNLKKEISNFQANPLNPVEKYKIERKIRQLNLRKEMEKADIAKSAYTLYKHANEGELPFMVVGGEALRSSDCECELKNFGVLSEETPGCSKKLKRDNNVEKHKGSILCDTNWSIIKNDAYVLGSIHAKKTFYLFGENGSIDATLWDEANNRPHVAGRELAMLYEAGYRQVATDAQKEKYGATFVCLDPQTAENFTFERAIAAAKKIHSLEQFSSMLKFFPEKAAD
ncbi:MAG: hypothetical protein K1000chlam3_00170 [Chlamydiae bacterium]|nr:hypothetical protein [Chlamydiota bacterium]